MTTQQPARPTSPTALAVGIRALDARTGHVGVVQLFQDGSGGVRTEAVGDPTWVLLRPVGGGKPAWWVAAADLRRSER